MLAGGCERLKTRTIQCLPAGIWLMMSAVGGLLVARRKS